MTTRKKEIIGVEEWCRLPSLDIPFIKARIDTGAKTSSLHAFNIEAIEHEGKQWVHFEVHPLQKNKKITVKCEAEVIARRTIKSSNGQSESRYVIKAPLKVGDSRWNIEINLTNRDSMGFRFLIGREAIEGRFLVDPEDIFCFGEFDLKTVKRRYSQ